MTERIQHLKAIVLDWAGTTVDHGSRAPAIVMQEIYRRRGIDITMAQARGPMGMAKRDHIAAIAALPEITQAWKSQFGHECSEADIDAMYADFLPLQKQVLKDHALVIDGIPEAIARCRDMGLKIGSSTGYTRELMEIVTPSAREQGYEPDCVLCVEDAPRGRPAPYLLFEAAKRLDVYPMWAIVKVDDTPVGIEAGRNAGCWTVGITRTGNCVGLSADEAASLPEKELNELCSAAADKLKAAGAHDVLESVADLPDLLTKIERRLSQGDLPF
ncbi:MAG: phosphonoacetaldehyde hydrolase [Planctomycetaceae bacterium]|nr:phosphonoacetaldehyde hydrolase [Planctomycetaceae bacterium]